MNALKTLYDNENNEMNITYHNYSEVGFENNILIYCFLFLTRKPFIPLDLNEKKEYIHKYRLSLVRQLSETMDPQYDSIIDELKPDSKLTIDTFHRIISEFLHNKYQLLIIEQDNTYFFKKTNVLSTIIFLKREEMYYPVQLNGSSIFDSNGSEIETLFEQMNIVDSIEIDSKLDDEDNDDKENSQKQDSNQQQEIINVQESDLEHLNFNEVSVEYEQEKNQEFEKDDIAFQLNMLLNGEIRNEPFVEMITSPQNTNQNRLVQEKKYMIVDVSRNCASNLENATHKSVYATNNPNEHLHNISLDSSAIRSTIPASLYNCVQFCESKSYLEQNRVYFDDIIKNHSIEINKKQFNKPKKICNFLTNIDFIQIYKRKLYLKMTMDQIKTIAIENDIDVPNISNKNKLVSKIIDELPYPKQTIHLEDLRQISIDHNLPFSDAISLNENIENFRHVNLLQDAGRNEKNSNYCSMDESLLLKQYLLDEEIENSDVPIAHTYEYINVLKEDSFYTTGLFIQNGIVNNVQFMFDIDKYFQELDDATLPCECDIEFFRTLDKNNPVPYGTAKGKMVSRNNGVLTIEYKNQYKTYSIDKLKEGDFSNMSFFVFPSESKQFRFNKKKLLSNNI